MGALARVELAAGGDELVDECGGLGVVGDANGHAGRSECGGIFDAVVSVVPERYAIYGGAKADMVLKGEVAGVWVSRD